MPESFPAPVAETALVVEGIEPEQAGQGSSTLGGGDHGQPPCCSFEHLHADTATHRDGGHQSPAPGQYLRQVGHRPEVADGAGAEVLVPSSPRSGDGQLCARHALADPWPPLAEQMRSLTVRGPLPLADEHQPRWSGCNGDRLLRGEGEVEPVHPPGPLAAPSIRFGLVVAGHTGRAQGNAALVAGDALGLEASQRAALAGPHMPLRVDGVEQQRELCPARAKERLGHVGVLGDERVRIALLQCGGEGGFVVPAVQDAVPAAKAAGEQSHRLHSGLGHPDDPFFAGHMLGHGCKADGADLVRLASQPHDQARQGDVAADRRGRVLREHEHQAGHQRG